MNPSIEETIDRVEQLYATITGRQPPHVDTGTRIPPESDPMRHVEDQLVKLVSTLEDRFVTQPQATPAWMPRVLVWQDDAVFELAIDVPGVARDQLEVRLEADRLVVTGQRTPPWTESHRPDACEAPLGAFARTFPLPERVDAGQISARLDSGVLRVRIARRAAVAPSQIPVSSS